MRSPELQCCAAPLIPGSREHWNLLGKRRQAKQNTRSMGERAGNAKSRQPGSWMEVQGKLGQGSHYERLHQRAMKSWGAVGTAANWKLHRSKHKLKTAQQDGIVAGRIGRLWRKPRFFFIDLIMSRPLNNFCQPPVNCERGVFVQVVLEIRQHNYDSDGGETTKETLAH